MANSPTLLTYDWSGCVFENTGLRPDALEQIEDRLVQARSEVLDVDMPLFHGDNEIPPGKQPLDAGFVHLPHKILNEFKDQGAASELGRILATAKRLKESVDQVVVLGIGGSYMGARAMMEACRHGYHNELSREVRGGIPRMYFEGNNVDNDAARGMFDLLEQQPADRPEGSWAVVVISKSGGTLETASAFRWFVEHLTAHCGGDRSLLANRIVPVTGNSGKLFDLSTAMGCSEIYKVPDGVGGRFSVLSPVGLVPAALLGLNLERLLQGAVDMTEHFRTADVGENVVLDYVGICHLLETHRDVNLRVTSVWSKSLESVGLWYDQLLAESLGKEERGATPMTVVNTRDLHSRAQQHQEGSRDKLMTNIVLSEPRREALRLPKCSLNQDGLNKIAGTTMPEILTAAFQGTNQAYLDDQRPTADIRLAELDEYTLGQLFQMLMLATVVEGRLIDINPYGQPGVEAYKRHMMKNIGLA